METRNQLTSVFNQLQRCHTAFADFYPHPGLLKIGGSKVLLPTRLMRVLQECTLEMQHAISGLDESTPQSGSQKRRLVALWTELGELLLRLLKFGRERDTAEVNEAARLPYLASGLSWNYLVGTSGVEPAYDSRYLRIEPTIVLLARHPFLPSATEISLPVVIDRLRMKIHEIIAL